MILIDTDHATYLKYHESDRGRRLVSRLEATEASEIIGVAIVTVEERIEAGWQSLPRNARRFGKLPATESWRDCLSFTNNSRLFLM